ncbi:uncharacterized protein LOC105829094 [Monomorium pharaonis]|uniref:uncharacterized protein LOC105829094 n=1 Tax=Monomorium pharaonis TaxID=307658 RepID=UPI00063ED43E|nr:uncharacterized protein LOC105829094 [Monomorium pharaonis]
MAHNLRSADEVGKTITQAEHWEDIDDACTEEEDAIEEKSSTESEETESSDELQNGSNNKTYTDTKPSTSKRARVDKGSILGKNGYRWCLTPPQKNMNKNNPISIPYLPGPIKEARDVKTPYESWSLLFSDNILNIIIIHTNAQIKSHCNDNEINRNVNAIYKDLDIIELKAFIGLLYISGLQKNNNTSLEDLWSAEYGIDLYRATMPLARFKFICRCLRFDDISTRTQRQKQDKFALIRELWTKFISRCTQFYIPTPYCTIDEQLLSFQGRCPFKVHNKNIPNKYGIKIIMMNDSRTFYMYTAEPYVGKVNKDNTESLPSYYIRTLSQPIHGTLRNITCDNWFSSVEIFDKMLQEHSITMVGTLKKNNPEIPLAFKKSGAAQSSKYAFDATKTLVSYTPKENKIVLLLSTFHNTPTTDNTTGKSDIITFYNLTKGATDTFKQMCHEYTTVRRTRRWPMRVFFSMLDQCIINAMVLYNFNTTHESMRKRDFIKSCIRDLTRPHLERRRLIPTLRRSVYISIQGILGLTDDPRPEIPSGKLARCRFCPRSLDRKTRIICATCNVPVCENHRIIQCSGCRLES